jgi:hypothetical protein
MAGTTQTPEEEAAARRRAAEINTNQNNQRVSRIEEIARGADARRSADLEDTDGAHGTGRFAGGELDDSPEARERAAEIADREAEEALEEERIAAARAISDEEQRARELQAEGLDPDDAGGAGDRGGGEREQLNQAGDEKTVGGVKYYLTIVNGKEKWLTLEQLRGAAQKTEAVEVALQRANDAVKQATQLALQPKDTSSELSDGELEDVIASAALGDGDAVKKLVSVIKARPSTPPVDVSRQVSEQLATQRAIDTAEREQADILKHASLGRFFRMRLGQLARDEPELQIIDAYRKIGREIRQEFAPMLKAVVDPDPGKAVRKRSLVNPPRAASRATRTEEDETEEESPSAIADRMAKARGQQRAIRHGRVPG